MSEGIVESSSTKEGISSAEFITSHIFDLAPQLTLTSSQEQQTLSAMGMSALASEGERRKRNILESLNNAMSDRYAAFGSESHAVEPWQAAVDWNSSLLINEVASHSNKDGQLIYSFSKLLTLWRSTSPFTQYEDGSFPQYELQTSQSHTDIIAVVRREVQKFLSSQGIHEITLHKALRWENHNSDVPMSMQRPDWYKIPLPDNSDDGFDEEPSEKAIGAGKILMSRYSGWTSDREAAVQMARYAPFTGEPSEYYAVLSGTFPTSSIVSIPTLGFSSLAKSEIVVDRSAIQSGRFAVTFGRSS